MQKSITHTYFFQHSAAVVWEYLTNPELMRLWLMKNDFMPIVGHRFNFKTNPLPQLNFDGVVHCTVLDVRPETSLSYSWQCGPGEGKIELDSIVEWKLVPRGNGTELQLNHVFSLFENEPLFEGFNHGWPKHMKKIDDNINASAHATTTA